MRINVQNKRKNAIDKVNSFLKNPSNILIIHYSCEGFDEPRNGRSARITSIAVKSFETGQVTFFSLNRVAEIQKIDLSKIEHHYDILEKKMLKLFFSFLKRHKEYYWIHWNMRDINFGFDAISHRFKVLGGKIENLTDDHKLDLAKVLIDIYGENYIDHPRFKKLMELNNITNKFYLGGDNESKAFKNKEFTKLNLSTLRKVEILRAIFDKLVSNTLKHNATFIEVYGLSPQGFLNFVNENPLGFVGWNVALILLGAVIGKFV